MRRFLRSFLLSFLITFVAIIGLACKDSSTTDPASHGGASEWVCGSYKGHTLYSGPQGGCYYYNSSGNKTYVDRSNCNC